MSEPITIKLQVEKFLANYYKTLYGDPVKFSIPLKDPLGISIISYTTKQPVNQKPSNGTLEIVIPEWGNKNPKVYNYLSDNSIEIIHQEMIILFFAGFYRFITDAMRIMQKKNAILLFMETYHISEDDIPYDTLRRRCDRYIEEKSTKIRKRFRNVAILTSDMCPKLVLNVS